jgi:hypothetical protein
MNIRLLGFIVLLTLGASTPALAQEPPLVEVRGAFGATNYLHGDFDFVAPTALVSARVGRAVAIEVEFGFASHEEVETFGGSPAFPGPVTTTERRRFQSLGVNVVRRWSGQIAPFVGGGVGVYAEPRRFEQRNASQTIVTARTEGPRGGAQAHAGLDFRINSRIAAFGQVRFEMRTLQDPAGGAFQGLGGVAIALK